MKWIMGLFIMVNGLKMDTEKEKALRSGKTEVSISDIGKTIRRTAREDLCMLMEMSMKESGIMTKLKEEVPTNTWTVPNTSETGRKTDNMATE
jgi:hypothetical protein